MTGRLPDPTVCFLHKDEAIHGEIVCIHTGSCEHVLGLSRAL